MCKPRELLNSTIPIHRIEADGDPIVIRRNFPSSIDLNGYILLSLISSTFYFPEARANVIFTLSFQVYCSN